MKITKLNQPALLIAKLEKALLTFGIELYDIDYPTKASCKFRAKRQFNKPYYGGGTKSGSPIHSSIYYAPKAKQAKYLHWEEWAIINELINNICDNYNLGGQFKSYFDGELQWIRKDNKAVWNSPINRTTIDELIQVAIQNLGENAVFPKLQLVTA